MTLLSPVTSPQQKSPPRFGDNGQQPQSDANSRFGPGFPVLPLQNLAQPLQNMPQVLSSYANIDKVTQNLGTINTYGGDELLALLGPRAASVAPLLTPGYIGLDVFNKARQSYLANEELPRRERIKRTAIKTGDVLLMHTLASVGIPLLLTRRINRLVKHLLAKPKVPEILVKNPKWVTGGAVLVTMIVLSKPIRFVTDFVLDWTYRPLLERKRRKEVQKILQTQWDRQLQFFQGQKLFNRTLGLNSSQV
ncbi:MAG TPA: hypothetical protein V6C99_07205 [Oculatellaceae cyanobacterium]